MRNAYARGNEDSPPIEEQREEARRPRQGFGEGHIDARHREEEGAGEAFGRAQGPGRVVGASSRSRTRP